MACKNCKIDKIISILKEHPYLLTTSLDKFTEYKLTDKIIYIYKDVEYENFENYDPFSGESYSDVYCHERVYTIDKEDFNLIKKYLKKAD